MLLSAACRCQGGHGRYRAWQGNVCAQHGNKRQAPFHGRRETTVVAGATLAALGNLRTACACGARGLRRTQRAAKTGKQGKKIAAITPWGVGDSVAGYWEPCRGVTAARLLEARCRTAVSLMSLPLIVLAPVGQGPLRGKTGRA
jgi:hypothetical protein